MESRYSLLEKIGNGHFGIVYVAENKKHQKVAIKIDTSEYGMLRHEAKILNYLTQRKPNLPIPHVFWFGNVGENSLRIPRTSQCMAMTWFNGGSLKEYLQTTYRQRDDVPTRDVTRRVDGDGTLYAKPYVRSTEGFDQRSEGLQQLTQKVASLPDELPEGLYARRPYVRNICLPNFMQNMLSILQQIHEKYVIHRDIKPENIVLHCPKDTTDIQIQLIDFGLATFYIDGVTGNHIPENMVRSQEMIGSPVYATIYTHQGIKPSRRDDCIQLGYVYLYMILEGHLPWEGIATNRLREQIKREYVIKDPWLASYMERCMRLKYNETPDYLFI
jgi:serine/threonine protein kinase